VHEFWETYEEYFKPLGEEAVKAVLQEPADESEDDSFKIPRLGPVCMRVCGMYLSLSLSLSLRVCVCVCMHACMCVCVSLCCKYIYVYI
jgi:hypothetical protein